MLTNGQDRSADIQRERARRELEVSRAAPSMETFGRERVTPPRPGFVSGEPGPRPDLLTLLERESASNVGVQHRPGIVSGGHSTPFPARTRRQPTGLAEGYKNICERWSLNAVDMARLLHLEEEPGLCEQILSGQVRLFAGDLKDRAALVIGISLGLGELFDDDKDAEVQWLNAPREKYKGRSCIAHMLEGDFLNIRDVADLVDNARGLR